MRQRVRWTFFATAMAVVMAVGACSGAGSSSAPASAAAAKVRIGVSVPDVQGPFFLAMLYGIYEQAEVEGADVVLLEAGGYSNLDKQISQMEDLIQQKVDGILIDPIDDNALQPIISKAVEAGIPVVGAGDPVAGKAISEVTTDHVSVGRAMADWVVKNLKPGKLIGESGPAGANWSTSRWKAFKDIVVPAGWQLVAEQNSDPARDIGLKLTEDLLQRFPDADLIYAADNAIGLGTADAVRAAGRVDMTKIVTVVIDEDTKAALKDGSITMTVAQQTVAVGRQAVTALVKAIRGETIERSIKLEPVVVTKDNVDTLDYGPIAPPAGWTPGS